MELSKKDVCIVGKINPFQFYITFLWHPVVIAYIIPILKMEKKIREHFIHKVISFSQIRT